MKTILFTRDLITGAWNWIKVTMFILGLVYTYQFIKLNWYGGSTAYQVEVLEGMIEESVQNMLSSKPKN